MTLHTHQTLNDVELIHCLKGDGALGVNYICVQDQFDDCSPNVKVGFAPGQTAWRCDFSKAFAKLLHSFFALAELHVVQHTETESVRGDDAEESGPVRYGHLHPHESATRFSGMISTEEDLSLPLLAHSIRDAQQPVYLQFLFQVGRLTAFTWGCSKHDTLIFGDG